jgi:enamine deaminase RidA (YjgF/YER057c/UK114 family)
VVEQRVFATDLDTFAVRKARRLACCGQTFPAAGWVQVQRLEHPALVVEVELAVHAPG